ncbi:hypothetical protein DM860_007105 [Cuscuta australis]|uniref:Uncharacterized protein n=1 Tax=Cuscuta australis TaxID=267555 RepID=A0A328EA42_9ASTE|nr:hypothetical protein DM860_007105 [Cuscuta australis]
MHLFCVGVCVGGGPHRCRGVATLQMLFFSEKCEACKAVTSYHTRELIPATFPAEDSEIHILLFNYSNFIHTLLLHQALNVDVRKKYITTHWIPKLANYRAEARTEYNSRMQKYTYFSHPNKTKT